MRGLQGGAVQGAIGYEGVKGRGGYEGWKRREKLKEGRGHAGHHSIRLSNPEQSRAKCTFQSKRQRNAVRPKQGEQRL